MPETLNILSIGAGAIGTYIGGSLALHGHKVTFVERPELVENLQSQGFRLNLQGKENHIFSPRVVGSIEDAVSTENFDIALFALKSYDTQSFLDSVSDLSSFPPFLCLSNGIDNEPNLAAVLGNEKVIAGTVTSAIGRLGIGNVILERLRGIGIAAGHSLSSKLVQAFSEAGLNAHIFSNGIDMKWSKMLTNLIGNATSAILDIPPGNVFAHPGLYQLEISQLREALLVMHATEIKVVDLPGTPVRLLAFAVNYLPLTVSRPLLKRAVGGGRGGKMPSFHIDLHSGRGKSEVDYLNGAVVRAGEMAGILTPVNRKLRNILTSLTNGEIPLGTFQKNPNMLIEF